MARSPLIRYFTPLRYPGGKAKLAPFVKLLLRENGLLDGHYIEPYAGGASVALSLLMNEYVSHVHINDLDPAVHAFWHSALFETNALCRMIRDKRVTAAEWRRQRAIHDDSRSSSKLERGFSTLFLNRTNRSGIICSGGMIGGVKQGGKWKIDARYNKADLVRRVERVAAFRDRISLYNLDARVLIRSLVRRVPTRSLFYLDPPYYVKGKHRLYANFYEHADHATVADQITKSGRSWMVSYDNAPEIRSLYTGYRKLVYRLGYSAADRYDGAEVMFFSDDLRLPSVRNPTTVRDVDAA